MGKTAKSKKSAPPPPIRYHDIELLESHLHWQDTTPKDIASAAFDIKVTHDLDKENSRVRLLVEIMITSRSSGKPLASLIVGHAFEITDINTHIWVDDTGRITMPKALQDALHSIAISTTRGVMYSAHRGTWLERAIVPIMDPRGLKEEV